MMRMLPVTLLLLAVALPATAVEPTPEGVEFFEKKIRPLLTAQCFSCHSAGQKVRGGLQLDSHAGLLKGGDSGLAVVPGEPEKSRLIKAIRYQDDLRMPLRNKLPDEAIADLTAWVTMGPSWPKEGGVVKKGEKFDLEGRMKHWSFQPIRRATVPTCQDSTWARTPLDSFILAGLEKASLMPASLAEPPIWLRRVTFDLTGLPPTPDEIDAFEQDTRPDADRRVVERLLASPAYGERWGRHWLDLMRFAETSGHEFDFEIPEAYGYRDYVIRALNADLPYDQFVREHLAGDLLPNPRRRPGTMTNESVLGTGFWHLGESKHSPVDVRGDGADRRDNMIDVFGKSFLGLTIACARCHDHKFDPIPTTDYYALVGYLQSSRLERVIIDPPQTFTDPIRDLRELRAEANRKARAQAVRVLNVGLGKLATTLKELRDGKAAPEIVKAFQASDAGWVDHPLHLWSQLGQHKDEKAFVAARTQLANRPALVRNDVALARFDVETYARWPRTGYAFEPRPTGVDDLTLALDRPTGVARIRGPRTADSSTVAGRLQGAIRSPSFVIEKKHLLYHVAGKGARINLIIDGFHQIRDPIYGGLTFAFDHGPEFRWHVQNVSMWIGLRAYIEVLDDGDGFAALESVLASNDGAPPTVANRALHGLLQADGPTSSDGLATALTARLQSVVERWGAGQLADPNEVALLNGLLASPLMTALTRDEKPDADLATLSQKISAIEAKIPTPQRALGLCDGSGDDEPVYIRGNHKNLGDPVQRRFLVALAGNDQAKHPQGSGRLELAERLLAERNPLAARVIVNRVWQHHFGRGLVASVDNFGLQGQLPTHPELLDYLADEFRATGWSLKSLHRRMVLSATYRMSSRADEATTTQDPANRLWHRMPVRRLEAEAIRDGMLALSGRLDLRMYGRGPNPYLTEHMQGRGRPIAGKLDGEGRRSVYLNVRRNFLNPLFLAFDFPSPFSAMGQRSVSNVPAQALTLLNNPFVVQEARRWAERVLATPGTASERITRMYRAAFGRSPTALEIEQATEFLQTQAKEYGGQPNDVRVWADLAHVLFNVKEFIFVE